jgi:hypothetical protein
MDTQTTHNARENPTSAGRHFTRSLERSVDTIAATRAHNRGQSVSETNTSTYEYLLTHYGPLLTLKQVACVMHTTPSGLRIAIKRHQCGMAEGLATARRRLGRRVFFEARRVADIIDDNGAVSGRNLPATDPRTQGKDSRLAR